MLKEFALSPHLFDEKHHSGGDQSWLDLIGLFFRLAHPPGQAHLVVVSDLRDGQWKQTVDHLIDNASPHVKTSLFALKSKLKEMLVQRPACLASATSEDEWLHEADVSRVKSNIDRVVSTSRWGNPSDLKRVKCISDVASEMFWPEMAPSRCPRTEIGEQIAVLSPVVTHSEFLSFASAHLDIHGDKDLDFVIEMVKAARSRQAGFTPFKQLDLHTRGDVDSGARQRQATRIFDRIKVELGEPFPQIRIFFWPRLLERVLLAGSLSDGVPTPNVRWVIAMTHVVRPRSDPPDGDPPTWTVLPQKPASKWASRFYSIAAKPFAGSPHNFIP